MVLTPEQAVDTVDEVFGRHPGFRALHAKGVVMAGTFCPTADAASLTRAAPLQGTEVPVTVRFSNGSGNPQHPDWAPDPGGLAVKFYLPDGSRTDIVAVSTPRFPTRTPEGFVELVRAQSGGVAAVWKFPLFLARHPEAIAVLPVAAPSLAPPCSYATIPYYGPHAFRWIDADGGERHVRYKLKPAAAGITGPDTDRERGGDVLVFDPSRVTDGIECSHDPGLRFRPLAYSESIRRRTEPA